MRKRNLSRSSGIYLYKTHINIEGGESFAVFMLPLFSDSQTIKLYMAVGSRKLAIIMTPFACKNDCLVAQYYIFITHCRV